MWLRDAIFAQRKRRGGRRQQSSPAPVSISPLWNPRWMQDTRYIYCWTENYKCSSNNLISLSTTTNHNRSVNSQNVFKQIPKLKSRPYLRVVYTMNHKSRRTLLLTLRVRRCQFAFETIYGYRPPLSSYFVPPSLASIFMHVPQVSCLLVAIS
jgi:hypothetical protein